MEAPKTRRELEPTDHSMPIWASVFLPSLAILTLFLLVIGLSTLRQGLFSESGAAAMAAVQTDGGTLAGVQAVAFLLAIVVGRQLFARGQTMKDVLGLSPVPWEIVLAAAVAGAALQFPMTELSNLIGELVPISIDDQLAQRRLLYPPSPVAALGMLLAVVVVAPVSEEFLFRGLLLQGTARTYGVPVAVIVTSIAFAVSHLSVQTLLPALVSGLILGWVAIRTGSTLPTIALHACVNGVPLVLSPAVAEIRGFNVVSETPLHLPPLAVFLCASIAVGSLFLIHRMTRPI